MYFGAQQLLQPQQLGEPLPAAQVDWASWPPMLTTGTIGTPASIAVRT